MTRFASAGGLLMTNNKGYLGAGKKQNTLFIYTSYLHSNNTKMVKTYPLMQEYAFSLLEATEY